MNRRVDGHLARKRFGQNFLTDERIIAAIVAAFAPVRGQNVVEIGPGLGAITRELLAHLGQSASGRSRPRSGGCPAHAAAERRRAHRARGRRPQVRLSLTGDRPAQPARDRQPALQHFHPHSFPFAQPSRCHCRHDLYAAERSGGAHGGRTGQRRLRPAVRHAAVQMQGGVAAARATRVVQPCHPR
jgi:hypothetical protein